MIKFHNSQSRTLEVFEPKDPKRITMYVCGPTVYGPAHIGNARPALVFDQVFRLLRHVYGTEHVRYARNITDVDDKIIKAAFEQSLSIQDITGPALNAYHVDLQALNCLDPSVEPKATDHVCYMVSMINGLIVKKHAYEVDGEVFFHVPSNPNPGLANHTDLNSGERVAVDPRKKDPRDFVLWKPAKPSEPSWPSPWGFGRPGWHIECSAMISAHLGMGTIDIHGGGQDLRFPHHEAECAQSHCAWGEPLAKYWLHNGLLTVNGEKMSKSRGNVILLKELYDRVPAESVRYYFLGSHYRSPMDFSVEGLESANRSLDGIYELLNVHDSMEYDYDCPPAPGIIEALSNDLNTPKALSLLHELADQLRLGPERRLAKGQLLASGKLLGLFSHSPHQWRTLGVDKEKISALVEQRKLAREAKDFQLADKIRQQLTGLGITLADGVHGTEWRRS